MRESSIAQPRLIFTFNLPNGTITIGRAVDNDLIVVERGIALQHARIERVGETYAVVDLSGGETWVSQHGEASDLQPVSRQVLQPNALVQFSGALFRFLCPLQGAGALEREFEIRKLPTTIGADPDNDIALNDPTISRRHAEIEMDNGVYVIRDAGSTNGTFVAFNGEPAQERQIERNALRDGSLIRLGNVRLTFRVGWDAD